MQTRLTIRAIQAKDYADWRPLWDGYNAFYGRAGETALAENITASTWARFLNDTEPVHALVACDDSGIIGLVHFIYHRSTTRLNDVCYLQDLYIAENKRGLGVARALIEAVYADAAKANCSRVYWQTQNSNHTARQLYDKLAKHAGFIVYAHELVNNPIP